MPAPNTDRPPTGQLPLALVAEAPAAPLDMRPMLARSGERLPTDGRHLYDVAWGGLRALAHLGRDRPYLLAHGRDVTAAFPEVSEALRTIGATGTILDGEIVVPDRAGGLDRAALRARIRGTDGAAAATFVVSDLPWLEGRALLAEPLRMRRARLDGLALDRSHLVTLAPTTGGAARLLAAALERGLAAVVAKRIDSPYLPGVRSRLWRVVRVRPDAAGPVSDDRPIADEPAGGPLLALLRTLPLGEDG
ncbi:MAG: hypothetical protein ACHQ15_02060 [Candidatus Limnocylindrales bacterium]